MFQERVIKDLGGLQKVYYYADPSTREAPVKIQLSSSGITLDNTATSCRIKSKQYWDYQVSLTSVYTCIFQIISAKKKRTVSPVYACVDLSDINVQNIHGLHI